MRAWTAFPVALTLALLLAVPLLVVLLVPTVVATRICTRPIDMSSVRDKVEDRLQLPDRRAQAPSFYAAPMLPAPDLAPHLAPDVGSSIDRLEDLVDRVLAKDRLRYWFHAVLGRGLQAAKCDPAASGLQWIKAAAHARSESQLQRTIRGLQRDTARSSNRAVTDAILCTYVPRPAASGPQGRVMLAAGVRC